VAPTDAPLLAAPEAAAPPHAQASEAGLSEAARAAFAPAGGADEAEAFTRRLARGHYENFSVVTRLLPRPLRQDFCNIYAFCRLADDLADEPTDATAGANAAHASALRNLDRFRDGLHACYAGRAGSAVFIALGQTIRRRDIPIDPFLDLISAFEQDQRVTRYDTFEQLLDYCRRSANPVGRLVLYLCGYRDAERQRLSDYTCSALQLANFWQDVRRDLRDLGRVYLPRESMERFGVTEADLWGERAGEGLRQLIRAEVDRAEAMFAQGDALLPLLHPSVRRQVALFGAGGRAVLQAIRRQEYDTLARRPVLSAGQKARLALRVVGCQLLGGKWFGGKWFGRGGGGDAGNW
jgi:squalene synthase HpnC